MSKEGKTLRSQTARNQILALARRIEPKVISIRRELHRIPEASFGEVKTHKRVCTYLRKGGVKVKCITGSTGIIATIRGKGKRVVALRADMDALNIQEETRLSFASVHKGYMHACGHDAHMAIVLGAGVILNRLQNLPGNLRLIFQPAEETPPGGALGMIKAGALKAPKVDAILGIHVDPAIPTGKVAVNVGAISASADDFRITIKGRGGHGSSPHRCVDAIVIACQFVSNLQSVISRMVGALDSAVVSVGRITGGARSNIIADKVVLEGTIRARNETTRRKIPRLIRQMLRGITSAYGADHEFEYIKGYPAVICDETVSQVVKEACIEILGKRNLITTQGFEMGGEDFAYYARLVSGTVIFLGVGKGKKTYPLHHAKFDIDERALGIGVRVLSYSAYQLLGQGITR